MGRIRGSVGRVSTRCVDRYLQRPSHRRSPSESTGVFVREKKIRAPVPGSRSCPHPVSGRCGTSHEMSFAFFRNGDFRAGESQRRAGESWDGENRNGENRDGDAAGSAQAGRSASGCSVFALEKSQSGRPLSAGSGEWQSRIEASQPSLLDAPQPILTARELRLEFCRGYPNNSQTTCSD